MAMVICHRGDRRLASVAPHTTDDITSILHLDSITGPPTISTVGQDLGSSAALAGLLAPLLAVPGAPLAGNVEMPYLQLQLLLAGCVGKTFAACHTVGVFPGGILPRQAFNATSDYVAKPLPSAGLAAMVAATEAPGSGALLCDSYGGAVNRLAPTATAFAHRKQLFCIQYHGKGPSASWIDQAWTKMRPYVSGQAYQNYIDPTLKGWQQAYYAENRRRSTVEAFRVPTRLIASRVPERCASCNCGQPQAVVTGDPTMAASPTSCRRRPTP